jgi:GT2 family glycosyltransferase
LKRTLDVAATKRCLQLVNALQKKRLGEIASVGSPAEQTRPEVVVLALEKRRVVAEIAQCLPVDDDRRMEEWRAEQRVPANRERTGGHEMKTAVVPVLVEIADRRTENAGRTPAQRRELSLEPQRQRDVVGIHARDVRAARFVQRPVERSRKPELLVIAQNAQPRIGQLVEDTRRSVRRSIVDDKQLEVAERLAEDALDRRRDKAVVVVDGEQDGKLGHGASVRRVTSFDLILATVGRVDELQSFFDSLERQTGQAARVLVVDQNADDRLQPVLAKRPFELVQLTSAPGLSRARNVALAEVAADVVGFPDDDCLYPDGLLGRVAQRFASNPELDGLTGRSDTAASWALEPAMLTRENLWNRAISYALFLRRSVVQRVGAFDETLGLPSSSGEEIDYLIRALDSGARIEYDPTLVVHHGPERRNRRNVASRDGVSIGYILRKHRYPPRTIARMFVRPAGGALVAFLRNDRARAAFHLSTLRGRLRGYQRPTSTW